LDKYHKTVSTIIDLLNKNNVWFETFEHEPVRTSEEASKIRTGYKINQGAKAIILRLKFRDKNKAFAMVVLPGDKRFSIGLKSMDYINLVNPTIKEII